MRAVIDRFEGDIAVVLLGDREWRVDLPVSMLPEAAAEGDVLEISMEIDRDEAERTRDSMRERIDRLRRLGRE